MSLCLEELELRPKWQFVTIIGWLINKRTTRSFKILLNYRFSPPLPHALISKMIFELIELKFIKNARTYESESSITQLKKVAEA
jgi:hypothetical protein